MPDEIVITVNACDLIELVPHVGKERVAGGLIQEVVLPQKQIMLGGTRLGYVGDHPGAPICLIHAGLSEELKAAIKAKVDSLTGTTSMRVSAPPVIPEEIAAQIFGSDDEDGDE